MSSPNPNQELLREVLRRQIGAIDDPDLLALVQEGLYSAELVAVQPSLGASLDLKERLLVDIDRGIERLNHTSLGRGLRAVVRLLDDRANLLAQERRSIVLGLCGVAILQLVVLALLLTGVFATPVGVLLFLTLSGGLIYLWRRWQRVTNRLRDVVSQLSKMQLSVDQLSLISQINDFEKQREALQELSRSLVVWLPADQQVHAIVNLGLEELQRTLSEAEQTEQVNRVRSYLVKGALGKSLQLLPRVFTTQKDTERLDTVLLIISRYNRVNQEMNKGVIDRENYDVEMNRLTKSVLGLANAAEENIGDSVR